MRGMASDGIAGSDLKGEDTGPLLVLEGGGVDTEDAGLMTDETMLERGWSGSTQELLNRTSRLDLRRSTSLIISSCVWLGTRRRGCVGCEQVAIRSA